MNSKISLDDFGLEPDGIASATGARVGDILAQGVPIRWDEAVALVQEVVEIAATSGGDNAVIPGFNDILIDGNGTVTLQGTRRGERGPVAAGRALHALLASADVPVPLRLFVTQANAPETHKSLQAFAEGLAYFGRPGRADMIKGIYARYRSSSPTAVAPKPGQPAAPPPLPKDDRADQPPRSRAVPRWLMAAAVVVALVSLAAVAWFGVLGGGGSNATSVVTQAKAAIASVTPAIKNALGSATSAPKTAEAPAIEQKKSATAARSRTQTTPGSNRVARTEVSRGSSATRSTDLFQPPFGFSPAATAKSAETAVPVIPTITEEVVAPHEGTPGTIYSPADLDVQPPVMLYPSLPPPVFFAKPGETVVFNRMEILVAADGSVERVRLTNGPTRMPDMMLLSGAKAWRFAPATKDGVPVRYRTSVTWSGFP